MNAEITFRWAGRLVLLAWAGFWAWFNLASLVGEMSELGMGAWINHGLLAAVILAVTALAFLKPRVGGIVLLVFAAGLGVVFHGAKPLVALVFIVPPALAGLLALLTTRKPPHPKPAP